MAAACIKRGIELALKKTTDALVTAPINKEALQMAGHPWPGHTEMLAHETNTRKAVMMMVGGGLRVPLVTTHLALKKVPMALTTDAVATTLRIVDSDLKKYLTLTSPRIAVCGLNPHCGEGGKFGLEEKNVIEPAIAKAVKQGLDCTGPFPADVIFHQALKGDYDAVVAMYHDQGNIPVKLLGFDTGVNVTLGLPIIRTSPDHGTAYDIVGQGIASPNSMMSALRMAIEMSQNASKAK